MFTRLRLLTIGAVATGMLAWTLPMSARAGLRDGPTRTAAANEQEPQPITAVVNVMALAEQEALSPARGPVAPRSIHRPQSRPDESEGPPAPQTWFPDEARGPRVASPAPAQTFSA